MSLKKILLLSTILSGILLATVYEDGEDGTIDRWRIYDNTPVGSVISNTYSVEENSRMIQFQGDGRSNSYFIGDKKESRGWNNSREKVLKWKMNFGEKYRVSVYVNTKKGTRVLLYDYKDKDKGFYKKKYIRIGLGEYTRTRQWVSVKRNLEADLTKYEPDNKILTINGLKVQGSGRIDNIELVKSEAISPLKISNIHTEKLKKDYTKIVWSLNHNATGQVEYGTTTAYGTFSKKENSFKYDIHKQSLRNLTPNTTYHYRVISEDVSGHKVMSKDYTFSTKKEGVDTSPLTLAQLKEMIKNNEDVTKVNTSQIRDMSYLFYDKKEFNQDISGWDVSNVKTMEGMFSHAIFFNQPLEKWDVSNVTNMSFMFYHADRFNKSLEGWDVSNVDNMEWMFMNAKHFNQPLEKWNVSNVTNMESMFGDTKKFNQPLEKWDVSNVYTMEDMFANTDSFNQPLEKWNVSNVTNMFSMFSSAKVFNQPLEGWDVSNVMTMDSMFSNTDSFNQPLEKWNVSNVKNSSWMFNNAKRFNQLLEKWNVTNINDMSKMFDKSAMKSLPSWYKK